MPSATRWIALGVIAGAVLAADQATKALVRSRLAYGEETGGFGPFSIHHVRNSGIAGGHLQGSALVMGIVTAVVVAGILVLFARHGGGRPIVTVAFGLLVGGSLGNLVDRLRLGYVTDFIAHGDGDGAFNVADVSILLGVAAVVMIVLAGSRSPRSRPQPDP